MKRQRLTSPSDASESEAEWQPSPAVEQSSATSDGPPAVVHSLDEDEITGSDNVTRAVIKLGAVNLHAYHDTLIETPHASYAAHANILARGSHVLSELLLEAEQHTMSTQHRYKLQLDADNADLLLRLVYGEHDQLLQHFTTCESAAGRIAYLIGRSATDITKVHPDGRYDIRVGSRLPTREVTELLLYSKPGNEADIQPLDLQLALQQAVQYQCSHTLTRLTEALTLATDRVAVPTLAHLLTYVDGQTDDICRSTLSPLRLRCIEVLQTRKHAWSDMLPLLQASPSSLLAIICTEGVAPAELTKHAAAQPVHRKHHTTAQGHSIYEYPSSTYSDMTITANNGAVQFRVHRVMLAQCTWGSGVLSSSADDTQEPIKWPANSNITADDMQHFLDWMYGLLDDAIKAYLARSHSVLADNIQIDVLLKSSVYFGFDPPARNELVNSVLRTSTAITERDIQSVIKLLTAPNLDKMEMAVYRRCCHYINQLIRHGTIKRRMLASLSKDILLDCIELPPDALSETAADPASDSDNDDSLSNADQSGGDVDNFDGDEGSEASSDDGMYQGSDDGMEHTDVDL